jgi:hypothetical protein
VSASRIKLVAALLVAVLLGAALYIVLTEGLATLRSSEPEEPTGPGEVPAFVYTPPDTVPTTGDYGPVGPAALVFAVPSVREGLTGRMENAWVAVSSQDGRYRALSVPHRPEPVEGAVALSPDGTTLAWGYENGVVVYDAVSDTARELDQVPGDPVVGAFSPDGNLLTVYAEGLHVMEVGSGEVVAGLEGVDERAARQAVWTPEGAALGYVEDGGLVTHDWRSGDRTVAPAPTIAPDATLAWSPSGEQLAAMREVRGVRFVEVFDVAGSGELSLARTVRPAGHAQRELLGWVNDRRVAVTALRIETGTLELAYSMSTTDTSPPTQLMQLPADGFHRLTMEVAEVPLRQGSARFEEPAWPATDVAKLVASVVVSVFLLGLYLTRRPRKGQSRRGGR